MLTSSEKLARLTFRVAKPMQAYAIIGLVASFMLYIAPLLSAFASLFAMLIIALMVIASVFTILADEGFRNSISDTTKFTDKVVDASNVICQYAIFVVVVAALFAMLSIVTALPDRTNQKWLRSIISGSIILTVCILCAVLYLSVPTH